MRVAPHRVVAFAAVERAPLHWITVREQHGRFAAVGFYADRICGEHVGAIQEICYAPEALGLALRAIDASRQVEPAQRLVRLGIAERDGLEREGFLGERADDEFRIRALIFARAELATVEPNGVEFDHLSVEPQRSRGAGMRRVALDLQPRANPCPGRVQGNVQIDGIN